MEQAAFDDHEDRVGNLADQLQLVMQNGTARKEMRDPQQKGLHRQLVFVETEMHDIASARPWNQDVSWITASSSNMRSRSAVSKAS